MQNSLNSFSTQASRLMLRSQNKRERRCRCCDLREGDYFTCSESETYQLNSSGWSSVLVPQRLPGPKEASVA